MRSKKENNEHFVQKDLEDIGYSKSSVFSIIHYLRKHNIITPIHWDAKRLYSDVSITEKGRRFVEDFIEPLEDIVSDKNIVIPEADITTISDAMDLARRASPMYNCKTKEERIAMIYDVIKEEPGLSRKDIAKKISMSTASVRKYMKYISDDINIVTKKGSYYYYLKE